VNGHLYRYTLRAVRNGVEGLPSNVVLARPGQLQPLAHPRNRILFLHGIASDASTWDPTSHFLVGTLNWNFGGTLSYLDDEDPTKTFPAVSTGFDARKDFFTVNFGSDCGYFVCSGVASAITITRAGRGFYNQADAVQGLFEGLGLGD